MDCNIKVLGSQKVSSQTLLCYIFFQNCRPITQKKGTVMYCDTLHVAYLIRIYKYSNVTIHHKHCKIQLVLHKKWQGFRKGVHMWEFGVVLKRGKGRSIFIPCSPRRIKSNFRSSVESNPRLPYYKQWLVKRNPHTLSRRGDKSLIDHSRLFVLTWLLIGPLIFSIVLIGQCNN